MATHNPTTPRNLLLEASYTESAFVARARLDGFLDADGYFVGPPDEVDFADGERPSNGVSHA